MSKIDISIITIVYKNPAGLAVTTNSLKPLLHSSLNWEHVVVDSSTEEHASVLANLQKEGSTPWPLVLVSVPPTGIYSAMNQGWRRSQGRLIIFLNGGDKLKSALTLEKAIKEFNSDRNLDLLLGTAELFRDGNYLYSKAPHPSFIRNILGFNGICHQAVVYRRSAFEKVGEFSTRYKLAGDYEHHFRCYLAGLKHKSMNLHLVEFDMAGQSSKWREVLVEYGQIHKALADQLSRPIVRLNELLLQWETTRLTVLKKVADSPLSSKLRPVWLWYQRKRAR